MMPKQLRVWGFLGIVALLMSVTVSMARQEVVTTPVPVDRWVVVGETAIGVSRQALVSVREGKVELFPLVEGLVVRTAHSPGGKYWAAVRIFPLPPTDRTPRKVWISIFQGAERLSNIPIQVAYDAPLPEIAINDAGELLVARREVATVTLYRNGQPVGQPRRLFPNADYDLERIVYVQPAGKTNGFIVAATRHGMNQQQRMEPFLIKMNASGAIEWQREVTAHAIGRLAVSPEGKWIALAAYRFQGYQLVPESRVYDATGNRKLLVDLIFKTAAFHEATGRVALANNEAAVMLDVSRDKVNWRQQLAEPGEMITRMAFEPSGEQLALLIAKNQFTDGRFQFVSPRLIVLSPRGDISYQQVFPDAVFQQPLLQFQEEPATILVGFQNAIQKIRIDQ